MSNTAELVEQKPVKQSDLDFLRALGIDSESKPAESNDLNKAKVSKPATNEPLSSLPTNITLASVCAASVLLGFFGTMAYAKKRDGDTLSKSLLPRRGMSESGAKLAFRALGWGTLYAVGGFSVITYGLYQLTKLRLKEFDVRRRAEQKPTETSEFDK